MGAEPSRQSVRRKRTAATLRPSPRVRAESSTVLLKGTPCLRGLISSGVAVSRIERVTGGGPRQGSWQVHPAARAVFALPQMGSIMWPFPRRSTVVQQLIVAAFLIAHGLLHVLFVSPRPAPTPDSPPWPFDLETGPLAASGRVTPSRIASLGRGLVLAVLVGYSLAALGALGILQSTAFSLGVVIGSVASLALLLAGFHRWLVIGIAIDVVLLLLVAGGWRPG
jgi:hypothetical protein